MQSHMNAIKACALFRDTAEDDITAMLGCLGAKQRSYAKGELMLRAGDITDSVGILLDGGAIIASEDFWGNRNILSKLSPSDIFAEAFACTAGASSSVSVCAEQDSVVLWLAVSRILTTCPSACTFHVALIRSLLSELAAKNLRLNEKLTHMGQRSTRKKVLSYLSSQAQKSGRREFDIPFNRQQLADYLSVERSALSDELSHLRSDGVIDFSKNHFKLNTTDDDI